MLLFDWNKIMRYGKRRSTAIVDVFEYITYKPIPKNKKDKFFKLYGKNFSGVSFVLHPERVLHLRGFFHDQFIAEYFGLCSYRSYATYATTGELALPLEHCPVDIEKLKNNTLIKIDNETIRLKLEEGIKWH